MTSPHCTRWSLSLLGLTLAFAALSLTGVVDQATAQQAPQTSDKPSVANSAAAEVEQRGQRKTREIKYGDWRKLCFKTAGTSMVCRTTISGTWETGQTAVRVDLIEREGDGTARLQIFLPVGLYLQAGVKLTIDQGNPYRIPYVWCLTNTCIAADLADPKAIRERSPLLEALRRTGRSQFKRFDQRFRREWLRQIGHTSGLQRGQARRVV